MLRDINVIRVLGLMCLLATSVAFAEPKQLVCSYSDPSLVGKITDYLFEGDDTVKTPLLPIGLQIGFANRGCVRYNNSYKDCDKHLKLRQIKNQCLATPEFPRYTFTFDTNDLTTGNKVNAEFSAETCGGTYENRVWYAKYGNTGLSKVGLTATPSVISFTNAGSKTLVFNVDRKTLSAGYGTTRLLKCEVRDVDMSQNAI